MEEKAEETVVVEDATEKMEENVIVDVGPPPDAFTQGLIKILEPSVKECDERVQAVIVSQEALSEQIEKLSTVMEEFSQASQHFNIWPYVQKLTLTKTRLSKVKRSLGEIQARVESMQAIAKRTGMAPSQPSEEK